MRKIATKLSGMVERRAKRRDRPPPKRRNPLRMWADKQPFGYIRWLAEESQLSTRTVERALRGERISYPCAMRLLDNLEGDHGVTLESLCG